MEFDERLNFALEATRTGLWNFAARGEVFSCDERVQSIIGLPPSVPATLPTFLSLFDEDDLLLVRRFLADPQTVLGAAHEIELPIRRLDTRGQRWIALRARRDPARNAVMGSARDISDMKRYDTQVHLLMREVTHRSKNLLAIIQAMARQTVKDSLSAEAFEARFSARLRGLSFSHELLASQDWRGASLAELCEGHLLALRERHGARVEIEGPVVFIRPEAAQNIGLALNELGSNAQQFGALSGQQGTIRVEWHIDAEDHTPHALHLLWTESGGETAIAQPSRQGFGHRVMERVVARALDGTVDMTFPPTGLRWSLKIPISHIASESHA